MKYYTLHIKDSGAIEDSVIKSINGKSVLICQLYNDDEFNSLNDILHSLDDYILNGKTLSLFKKSNTISFDLAPVIVQRKERIFKLLKTRKSYEYHHLKFREHSNVECYKWIDFDKSEITLLKGETEIGKLSSHEDLIEYIEKNKETSSKINEIYSLKISQKEKEKLTEDLNTYEWQTKKIVFNERFDSSIDVFRLPLYSWGTYVSERFKKLLENNKITDIEFAESKEELESVWKEHYPILEYN